VLWVFGFADHVGELQESVEVVGHIGPLGSGGRG
jgi:hypothetical protein